MLNVQNTARLQDFAHHERAKFCNAPAKNTCTNCTVLHRLVQMVFCEVHRPLHHSTTPPFREGVSGAGASARRWVFIKPVFAPLAKRVGVHRIASGALVHAKFCTLEKRAALCGVAA